MGKVATEATLQESVEYLRIIARKGTSLSSWKDIRAYSVEGHAKDIMQVGDTIEDTYKVSDSVSYTNVWTVLGFRTVTMEDGTQYDNVPIVQMVYTTHFDCAFDPQELEEATEETALEGTGTSLFYVALIKGKTVKSTTPGDYTVLSLSAGDTIDYDSYEKIYHSSVNSTYPAARGMNRWMWSWARQILNNKGTGWAKKMHTYDVLPSGADTAVGFMTYMPDAMLEELHPVKITTKQASYIGSGFDTTYDTFWLLSPSEMNIYDGNANAGDGDPFPYYQELLGINPDRADGKWDRSLTDSGKSKSGILQKYDINGRTTARGAWLRSANVGSYYEWYVNTSGNVNSYYYPYNTFRLAPACAII